MGAVEDRRPEAQHSLCACVCRESKHTCGESPDAGCTWCADGTRRSTVCLCARGRETTARSRRRRWAGWWGTAAAGGSWPESRALSSAPFHAATMSVAERRATLPGRSGRHGGGAPSRAPLALSDPRPVCGWETMPIRSVSLGAARHAI